MTSPLTFEMTIDRTSLVNGCDVDWEFEAAVTYRVHHGNYRRHTDENSGYVSLVPCEDLEILSVQPRDTIIGCEISDSLSMRELKSVEAAARKHYEQLLSEIAAEIGIAAPAQPEAPRA